MVGHNLLHLNINVLACIFNLGITAKAKFRLIKTLFRLKVCSLIQKKQGWPNACRHRMYITLCDARGRAPPLGDMPRGGAKFYGVPSPNYTSRTAFLSFSRFEVSKFSSVLCLSKICIYYEHYEVFSGRAHTNTAFIKWPVLTLEVCTKTCHKESYRTLMSKPS